MNLPELLRALENIPVAIAKSSYSRLISIKYLHDPLDALGSFLTGGRYNYIKEFEVLYVAPDPQTAVAETIRQHIPSRYPPKSLITIDVNLKRVIDLENPLVLKELEIDKVRLFEPWRKIQDIDMERAYTQIIGKAVFDSHLFEAIRYPSAKVSGKYNLAIFPCRLQTGSTLKVYDPEKLLEPIIRGNA